LPDYHPSEVNQYEKGQLRDAIQKAISHCCGELGVLKSCIKCELARPGDNAYYTAALDGLPTPMKAVETLRFRWTYFHARFDGAGGFSSTGLWQQRREDHTEIVTRRLDRILQNGAPLPCKLLHLRRCEHSLQKELQNVTHHLKQRRKCGAREGYVECRVLGRPTKWTPQGTFPQGQVYLFGGRPHLMLAGVPGSAGDNLWLACASLEALTKVRCGRLTEQDLAEVDRSACDVEDPVSIDFASVVSARCSFQHALSQSPEEARALVKVAEWWASLHPSASQGHRVDIRRPDFTFEPDPWKWPLRCFVMEALLVVLILTVSVVVCCFGYRFGGTLKKSRRKFDGSPTKVRRKSDESLAKV